MKGNAASAGECTAETSGSEGFHADAASRGPHSQLSKPEQRLTPDDDDEEDCCVCLEREEKAMIFFPCGHHVVLKACPELILSSDHFCPICRIGIKQALPAVF